MKILDSSHDHFHMIDDHGGYEWTYYDGFSEDGRFGFTAILFRGVPMSPNYAAAIDRGEGKPGNFAAAAFGLYVDGRNIASWLVDGRESGQFAGGDTGTLELGGVRLEKHGGGAWRIVIDGRSPLMRRHVSGEIHLRFPERSPDIEPDLSEPDPADATHYWVPVAPTGTFEASLALTPLFGRTRQIEFSGSAYHDRNLGFGPLQTHDVDWYWGRLHSQNETLIFYHIAARDESRPARAESLEFASALLIDRTCETVERIDDLQLRSVDSPHWASLPYPQRVSCRSASNETISIEVTTSDLLESGPFYHRATAEITCRWGDREAAGIGALEYLRPSRLGVRVFRPFVRFRARRRGGGIFR